MLKFNKSVPAVLIVTLAVSAAEAIRFDGIKDHRRRYVGVLGSVAEART